jgi:hypothetical protein
MYSRWSNAAVIILWLSAMSWLIAYKVLPPLLVGQPPSYRTILDAQRREPPVGWTMSFNDRQLGWALSTTSELDDKVTEVCSWVHFDEFPLEELAPPLFRKLVRPVSGLRMDAKNTTLIHPLTGLSSFRSEVRIEPTDDLITMQGTIEGSRLKLEIHCEGLVYETEKPIPKNALLSDALSPRTQLPGIHPGQTWTVPVYSPLQPAGYPVEILQATVTGTEPFVWNDRTVQALLVVYRRDSGHGLGSDERPRGKLWVHPNGTVLKQQVMIFNSTMTFLRLPDKQAAELERNVNRDDQQSGPR